MTPGRCFPTLGRFSLNSHPRPSFPGAADHGCDAGAENVHGSQGGRQPAPGEPDPAPHSLPDPGAGAIEGREGAAGGMGTLRPVPPVPPVPTSAHQCQRLERSQTPGNAELRRGRRTLHHAGKLWWFSSYFLFFPGFVFVFVFWSFLGWFSGAALRKTPWKEPGMGVWNCQQCWGGEKSRRKDLGKVNFRIFCTRVATGTTRIPRGNIPEDEGTVGRHLEQNPGALPIGFWGILVGIFSSGTFRMEEKRNWCETCEVVLMFSIIPGGEVPFSFLIF